MGKQGPQNQKNSAKTAKSPINWHLITCPSCGNTKFDFHDLTDDLQWTLECKKCQNKWTEDLNAKKPNAKKPTKAQIDAFQKAYDEAAKKVAQIKVKKKKTSPKRKPHQTRPTPEEEILIEERRDLVWEFHKAKLTIREISKQLDVMKNTDGTKKFESCSPATICADLDAIREARRQNSLNQVEDDIMDEIAILDEIHRAYYPVLKRKASGGKYGDQSKNDAAHFIMMAHDRRCKLKNLHKPTRIIIQDDRDFAAQLGLDPEDLPDADEN